jgi:hypothetical protein
MVAGEVFLLDANALKSPCTRGCTFSGQSSIVLTHSPNKLQLLSAGTLGSTLPTRSTTHAASCGSAALVSANIGILRDEMHFAGATSERRRKLDARRAVLLPWGYPIARKIRDRY